MFTNALYIIASYLTVGFVLSYLITNTFKFETGSKSVAFWIIGFTLAPALLSRITTYVYYLLPHQANHVYLFIVFLE